MNMQKTLIGEDRKRRRKYLAYDLKEGRVFQVVRKATTYAILGEVTEGSRRFQVLSPFWQEYCRRVWEREKIQL